MIDILKRPIVCKTCGIVGDSEDGFTAVADAEPRTDDRTPVRCIVCGSVNLIKIRLTLDKHYRVADQATPQTA